MAAPFLTSRGLQTAATLRLAMSSVAPVASGYERGWVGTVFRRLSPQGTGASDARFSRPESTTCSGGDC